jgi:hypothetical protein
MSTKLHDFPNNAILGAGVTPRTASATVTGSAADFVSGEGRCTAIQLAGTLTGTSPSLAGKIQESSDQAAWTDVTGATFAAVVTNDNVQAISFDRTKRYLRYVGTITGTSPSIPLAVVITEQKKQV